MHSYPKMFQPDVGEQSCRMLCCLWEDGAVLVMLWKEPSDSTDAQGAQQHPHCLHPFLQAASHCGWADAGGDAADKEPFEGFGALSQGLAVPLHRWVRAGASLSQLMALSFIFSLLSLELRSRKRSQMAAISLSSHCSGSWILWGSLCVVWGSVCTQHVAARLLGLWLMTCTAQGP